MTRNSVIHSGLALVASALCACGGHGSAGKTVETEDGGTAVGGTFVPQVGGVPDAAPPFGIPCPVAAWAWVRYWLRHFHLTAHCDAAELNQLGLGGGGPMISGLQENPQGLRQGQVNREVLGRESRTLNVKAMFSGRDNRIKESVGPGLCNGPAVHGYARTFDRITSPFPHHSTVQERGRRGRQPRPSVGRGGCLSG